MGSNQDSRSKNRTASERLIITCWWFNLSHCCHQIICGKRLTITRLTHRRENLWNLWNLWEIQHTATNFPWETPSPHWYEFSSGRGGKNREIKRKMCRFRAYLRLISLCNVLISTILYVISQISRLDTAYFSTPVILWLNAARCASAFDGDIRDAVMLKAQLIHRCAHHPLAWALQIFGTAVCH